ncbi:hypothetical protein AUEXF2481DRAFT_412725 [Aureobasidium subglaciale EXF-2481]|uniref:Uncharacterized protein n=1 Tax=Aureobasidium subglaciale (strain EXF-2481) TaxID=1043005 RepID=A0A074Z0P7_AURSE|nr:uncharacterized protein AUEXF2481DRAFT_412725 [Aureobasidium subglaciale EXF-2481]KEQ92646.1 hypothetical protein AUEXF2481DRAFT_412725 [Aureobasidium subglaciale EXF-2481]
MEEDDQCVFFYCQNVLFELVAWLGWLRFFLLFLLLRLDGSALGRGSSFLLLVNFILRARRIEIMRVMKQTRFVV